MLITSIRDLPDAAQRSEWSRRLGLNPSTFYRAEQRKQLKRLSPNGRIAVYRKTDILKWLQIEEA
jgi:hypothetical protein